MKPLVLTSVSLLVWGMVGVTSLRAAPPAAEVTAAIQAIQQAADPSAVVAAYASGFQADRNDPRLHDAYVVRMVALGLPELAYHQAQMLTGLKSNNGLAWGVIAYVEARQGQMPAAVSAIVLAVPNAPADKFVERTAGEIVAWYDHQTDRSQIPESTRESLTNMRRLLGSHTAYLAAYNQALKAYEIQTAPVSPPVPTPSSQAAPDDTTTGESYAATSYPVDYSVACSDAGPGWCEPYPWWWWQPVGCWSGCGFFPSPALIVFDDGDHFHHFHHHHDDFFHRAQVNRTAWHANRTTGTSFFGTPARPSPAVRQWARQTFHRSAPLAGSTIFSYGHRLDAPFANQPVPEFHGRGWVPPVLHGSVSSAPTAPRLAPPLPFRSGGWSRRMPSAGGGWRTVAPRTTSGVHGYSSGSFHDGGFRGSSGGGGYRGGEFRSGGSSNGYLGGGYGGGWGGRR